MSKLNVINMDKTAEHGNKNKYPGGGWGAGLLAEFVQKHKIEEEKEDFEVLRGRW